VLLDGLYTRCTHSMSGRESRAYRELGTNRLGGRVTVRKYSRKTDTADGEEGRVRLHGVVQERASQVMSVL
jgi:hypothetical protein